ncbi:MAG TPA: hypothetical protein VGE99_12695 [Candidatus Dormibacteraeota bacterium]
MLGFKRLLASVVISTAAVWLGSSAVAAAKPQPLPAPPDVTVNCPQGFSLVAHAEIDKEHLKTTTLANGTTVFQINGRFVSRITGNGKSLLFNSSGPATTYARPDGSGTDISRGRTLVIAPDLTGLALYSGHAVIDLATGSVLSHTGTVTDLCAAMAA